MPPFSSRKHGQKALATFLCGRLNVPAARDLAIPLTKDRTTITAYHPSNFN